MLWHIVKVQKLEYLLANIRIELKICSVFHSPYVLKCFTVCRYVFVCDSVFSCACVCVKDLNNWYFVVVAQLLLVLLNAS